MPPPSSPQDDTPDHSQSAAPRIVSRNPWDRTRRLNLKLRWWDDLYHDALTMRWSVFLLWSSGVYLTVNALFAALYLLQPGAIQGARPGSFLDAFFFSVQCISTIGFGGLSPATLYANFLVTAEAIISLAIVALATGSVFARISRPRARVMFAKTAVINAVNGLPTLQVRMANERVSQILSAEVQLTLLRFERTAEGQLYRRFYDLTLLRSRTPVFAITFTAMHQIDTTSPLYGITPEAMDAAETECLVTVTGLEETTSQIVHARYSYNQSEIAWGRRYRDLFGEDDQGRRTIDYSGFHDTEPAN